MKNDDKKIRKLHKNIIRRLKYTLITVSFLALEVIIALFIHDAIIRPYIGDVLVVIVLYTLIRIFLPEKCRLLPLYIFLFAALVEVLQYFRIVDILGLSESRFFCILIGGTFDWKDIICYGIGCILLFVYEYKTGDIKNKKGLK